jgi:hypothetical protein
MSERRLEVPGYEGGFDADFDTSRIEAIDVLVKLVDGENSAFAHSEGQSPASWEIHNSGALLIKNGDNVTAAFGPAAWRSVHWQKKAPQQS